MRLPLPFRSFVFGFLALTLAGRSLAAQKATTPAIPTPESSFGFAVGADYKLFDYEQSIAYFRRLAAASNRIKLLEVGQTSFGRPMMVAIISSPENLARLD